MSNSFWKRRSVWIVLGAIILLGGAFFVFSGKGGQAPSLFLVTRGEVILEVSVVGKVKPVQTLDLGFERSGRIETIPLRAGNQVAQGVIVATLERDDIMAQLAQAEANVKTQEIKLRELEQGTRFEDINIKEAELKKAGQDLANFYQAILTALQDSYIKADDAVRNQIDDFFINDESVSPQLSYASSDSQIKINVEYKRLLASSYLNKWNGEVAALLLSEDRGKNLEIAGENARRYLQGILALFADLQESLNNPPTISPVTLTSYKTKLTAARNVVLSSLSSVEAQQNAVLSQKALIERINSELILKKAGATKEEISIQEARVEEARANVRYHRSQAEKSVLRAPFSGTVSKVNFKTGDVVTANNSVLSLIGSGWFEIETNITESDISKVTVGNQARITLDAYGPDVLFLAEVAHIDISETVLEGVATYKTILRFKNDDERIRSGLTANVDISHDRKENVFFAPTRNIISRNGKKFVRVFTGEKGKEEIEERQVVTGLRGSDGRTEIISGLSEGEQVVTDVL